VRQIVTQIWANDHLRVMRVEEEGKERCYQIHDKADMVRLGVVCVDKNEWNRISHAINADWIRGK
jgi:hypothetical protein